MLVISLFVSFIVVLPVIFLLYIKWKHKYWARKRVPFVKPTSFWGNTESPFKQTLGLQHIVKEAYLELKHRRVPHGGIYLFTKPAYMPIDTELIKSIIQDSEYFRSYGFSHNGKKDLPNTNLFAMNGDPWKNARAKLTSIFVRNRMKQLFDSVLECGGPLIHNIDSRVKKGRSLDVKEVMLSYAIDVIGSCALGLESNSSVDSGVKFKKYGDQLTNTNSSLNSFYSFIKLVAPSVGKLIYTRKAPMELEASLINIIKKILNDRKMKGISRNDFIQSFIELEQEARNNEQQKLTMDEVAAQAYVFFVDGFEAPTAAITFLLHELAHNIVIQDTLREEIRAYMKAYNDKLTYDGIMEMKYLDQVINETLRKYPPIPYFNRVCIKPYKVPNTDITINEGTHVLISSVGIQHDPEYYPDPEKFEPTRFSDEEKQTRPAVSFLPFGEGSGMCIGQQFSLLEIKTCISLLINNYRFSPSCSDSYNLEFEPTSLVLSSKKPIQLNAMKISEHITRMALKLTESERTEILVRQYSDRQRTFDDVRVLFDTVYPDR
ncbi:cytochrome p450 [Holotrichia oblita]|uniref:Cytochrome p450 n=1 Tax=Holotrichia oblita TaxID=644536 RepID=A0ACB9TNN5_HOLOL|nr:cytochrome p450 [Holotrichia oblita]